MDVQTFLLRYFGSHERPAAVYDIRYFGRVVAPRESAEFAGDIGDVLGELVADAWSGRNERMPGNLSPDAWLELFDDCEWPLGDDGNRAEVPTLPLTAYRAGHVDGMSWTTDLAVAQKFADRGRDIYQCTVTEPLDVLGIFHDRDELEIVLRPGGSWLVTVTILTAP